jgi:hypothetical protein
VIQDFCEAMNERSGWWFTVLAGGPDLPKMVPSEHTRSIQAKTRMDEASQGLALHLTTVWPKSCESPLDLCTSEVDAFTVQEL